MFVPKSLLQSQNGQDREVRNHILPALHSTVQSGLSMQGQVGGQNLMLYQPPHFPGNMIPNQEVSMHPPFHPAYRPQLLPGYSEMSHEARLQREPEFLTLPPSDIPPEMQVRQAVEAVDNTITKAQEERDLAMRIAQYENQKRVEAEAEVKRLHEETKKLIGVRIRAEAMLSAAKAVELDDIFNELDNNFGDDLNFKYFEDNSDHEKISKTGHQYVDRISESLESLGDMSQLSDADFVNARYGYLMEDSETNDMC